MNKMHTTLEFNIIKNKLAELAASDHVKNIINNLTPYLDERVIKSKLKETTDAKFIITNYGSPPTVSMTGLLLIIQSIKKGEMLQVESLTKIAHFLVACKRMKSYLANAESSDKMMSTIGQAIIPLEQVESEINRCLRNHQVDDKASPQLHSISKKIDSLNDRIKEKLNILLSSKKQYFSDSFIVMRNGHYTVPLKKEYKKQIEGIIYDNSNSGNTLFIEPRSIARFTEQTISLVIDKDNEVRKILYILTALCEDYIKDIQINIEAMESLDFAFAKAKLSIDMSGVEASITRERKIIIKQGIHPLLKVKKIVPLDFEMGNKNRCLLITGPNTGGKTVTLKTVGLFSLMIQSGPHVPADSCEFCLINHVLCDIGDGQSINENLSTFSSHMTNIINIIEKADNQSLVLLDELGSGTDPAEGMGLAVALIEKFINIGCLFVATTHYPEIKQFGKQTEGVINAKMAFDRENLQPLYELKIGEAGESCALFIAEQLGLEKKLIKRARVVSTAGANNRTISIPKSKTLEKKKKSGERIIYIEEKKDNTQKVMEKFKVGDCVKVKPKNEIGIIFEVAKEDGLYGVQIKKKKLYINHKRLKLYIVAEQLYPGEYDFDIIFDTVSNRKAKKKMGKKHDPTLVVTHEIVEK